MHLNVMYTTIVIVKKVFTQEYYHIIDMTEIVETS